MTWLWPTGSDVAIHALSEHGGPIASLKFSQALSPSTTVLSPEFGHAFLF